MRKVQAVAYKTPAHTVQRPKRCKSIVSSTACRIYHLVSAHKYTCDDPQAILVCGCCSDADGLPERFIRRGRTSLGRRSSTRSIMRIMLRACVVHVLALQHK